MNKNFKKECANKYLKDSFFLGSYIKKCSRTLKYYWGRIRVYDA